MNKRERWLACFHLQPVDRIPDVEFGYWDETIIAWREQGMPEYIDLGWKAEAYFGMEGLETIPDVPVGVGMIPGFEYKVISEDDRHCIIQDYDGAVKQINKGMAQTIPHYIKFPIETRADWDEFKKRLDPDDPARYPSDQVRDEWIRATDASGQVRRYFAGSMLGSLRNWMGFENLAMAAMDDPEWVKEMIDYCGDFYCKVAERAMSMFQVDWGHFWEDVAFNKGPMLSPKLFKEWLTPNYKKVTQVLRAHGCDLAMVDCDGNINSVVDCWLEGDVSIIFPLEIRGNTDPYWIREKYGKAALLCGGVDKTQLIEGKDAIDREIERITPLVQMGGYVPHVDHRCPPDVTLENYRYYLRQKRKAFGIPEPAPWEDRKAGYDWAK